MRSISGAAQSSGSEAAILMPHLVSCSWIRAVTSIVASIRCQCDRHLAHGAAAMTSTSTRNSGREKPETIIKVEAGGGSLI